MTSSGQMGYNDVVENSPPKPQQPASGCEPCHSTQHSVQNCNKLRNMKLEDIMVELRKFNYCFRCMGRNHIAKFCKNKPVKCGKCNFFGHPTILHGIRELRQQQQQQRQGNATNTSNPSGNAANTNNNTNTSSQPSTSSRPTNPTNQQPNLPSNQSTSAENNGQGDSSTR